MLVFCCVWQPHRAWTSARGKYLYTRVCSVQLVRPERKRAPSCLRPKENYLFFLPSRRALQRWDLTGSHGCRCTRSAKGGHPPDISACSFNSPCKSLQLVFSLERCQAGDSPSVRRAVKSSWRSKFVRNLFLLKSVSSIKKNKSRKTKTKNEELEGPWPSGPRRHFTTCEVTTLPYMAPCLPAAANQRAVPSHVTRHEGSTAISLFRKSLASSAESFASRCMPNVPAECV